MVARTVNRTARIPQRLRNVDFPPELPRKMAAGRGRVNRGASPNTPKLPLRFPSTLCLRNRRRSIRAAPRLMMQGPHYGAIAFTEEPVGQITFRYSEFV